MASTDPNRSNPTRVDGQLSAHIVERSGEDRSPDSGVEDHAAAKEWYTALFGGEPPYFDMPGYFEFRIGDQQDELGVIDADDAPPGSMEGPAGAIVFWHVDDLDDTLSQLLEMGGHRIPARHRTRAGFRDRFGRRPVRKHPRHHDQPAPCRNE